MCTHFGHVTKIKMSLYIHLKILGQNDRLPYETELRSRIQIISLKQSIEFESEFDSEAKFRIQNRIRVWKLSFDFELNKFRRLSFQFEFQ